MVETNHLCRRRKNVTVTELPYDVFCSILLWLPVRSLICCLRVSKQWHSIIKSPMFANMHLKRITHGDHQNNHKLLMLYRNIPCTFSIFDCETLEVGPCRPVPFEVVKGNICIKSSCNGLVLVTLAKDVNDKMLSDIILWNPLTGDYKTLTTKPKYYKEFYSRGNVFEMYYNSSEEDYRILRITYSSNVYIYSLKSDTWRRIKLKDAFQSLPLFPDNWFAGTCWNQNIYFHKDGNKSVRFDTKTEKFTVIETPFNQERTYSNFNVQRGCMYLCVKYYIQSHSSSKEYIELWKMHEDGDWEKVATYTQDAYLHQFLRPLHLMRDGNWLMQTRSTGYELYKVDLENKHNEGSQRLNNFNCSEGGKYIETFVSPNI
ncbi:F-box/kelch-repeat protein-like protein [Tanacetum coccineum]